MFQFNEEFRKDHPETIGETDSHFDLDNYKDWLESKLEKANHALNELVFIVDQYSKGEMETQDYFRDEIKLAKSAIVVNEVS